MREERVVPLSPLLFLPSSFLSLLFPLSPLSSETPPFAKSLPLSRVFGMARLCASLKYRGCHRLRVCSRIHVPRLGLLIPRGCGTHDRKGGWNE